MMTDRWLVGALWASLAVSVTGQQPPSGLPPRSTVSGGGGASSTQPISQVAAATWTTSTDRAGQHTLQLLVVWRGQPGWFLGGRNSGSSRTAGSSGGSGRTFSATQQYGDITLRVQFDPATRAADIQGKRIDLGDHNVALIDDIDVAGPLKVAGLLRVDAAMPMANERWPDIEALIARSAELVTFLRCDSPPSNEQRLAPFALFCERILRHRASQTAQLEDYRTRYVLSFTPEGVPQTSWHPLTVEVVSGKYTIGARAGYLRNADGGEKE
jgi:hypothetical protein